MADAARCRSGAEVPGGAAEEADAGMPPKAMEAVAARGTPAGAKASGPADACLMMLGLLPTGVLVRDRGAPTGTMALANGGMVATMFEAIAGDVGDAARNIAAGATEAVGAGGREGELALAKRGVVPGLAKRGVVPGNGARLAELVDASVASTAIVTLRSASLSACCWCCSRESAVGVAMLTKSGMVPKLDKLRNSGTGELLISGCASELSVSSRAPDGSQELLGGGVKLEGGVCMVDENPPTPRAGPA